jgi:hypothetical protein
LDPKTRNIIQCKEDILFVWNSEDSCLLTLNVKTSRYNHAAEPTHQVRKENGKEINTVFAALHVYVSQHHCKAVLRQSNTLFILEEIFFVNSVLVELGRS